MKLFRVDFNSGRPPMITKGETRAKVSRDMKDTFGDDEINRVDYISVQDAQAEFGYWQFEGDDMGWWKQKDLLEKAKSKSQQRFMGMVRAAQKGELDNPSPEVAAAAKSMSAKSADDYASTKHKGLPDKVKKEDAMTDQNSPSNRNPQKKIKRTLAKVHSRKDMQEQVPATMADLKSLDKLVKKQRKLGEAVKQRLDPKCWDGYKKQGTKMKNGVRVNNCVPEGTMTAVQAAKAMQKQANAAKKKAQAQAMKAGYKTEAQDMRMGTVNVKSDAERKARADKYRAKVAARAASVKTMNKPSMKEAYKVQIKGLPAIYTDGASAGSVKAAMRKIVKRPDMIQSVDRATDAAQRQDFRMRATGKVDKATVEMLQGMDEDEARMIIAGMPANTRKGYLKAAGISEEAIDEKKKGLWANIHAKRKRGEKPAKPGEKGYPKTLDIGEEEEVDEAMSPADKAKAMAAYKAKGGTVKKVPAGKAQGYHGKADPGAGVAGIAKEEDDNYLDAAVNVIERSCGSKKKSK